MPLLFTHSDTLLSCTIFFVIEKGKNNRYTSTPLLRHDHSRKRLLSISRLKRRNSLPPKERKEGGEKQQWRRNSGARRGREEGEERFARGWANRGNGQVAYLWEPYFGYMNWFPSKVRGTSRRVFSPLKMYIETRFALAKICEGSPVHATTSHQLLNSSLAKNSQWRTMEKERVDASRISSRNRYARFIYICRSILEGRFRYLAKSYSRVVILLHGEASEREKERKEGGGATGTRERREGWQGT